MLPSASAAPLHESVTLPPEAISAGEAENAAGAAGALFFCTLFDSFQPE